MIIRDMNNSLHRASDRIASRYEMTKQSLEEVKSLLRAYNPELVLERGYVIVRGEHKIGAILEIETNKSKIKAEVKDVSKR